MHLPRSGGTAFAVDLNPHCEKCVFTSSFEDDYGCGASACDDQTACLILG